ncbi:MAG: hypothetical protein RIT43_765 [Bacteroidota bacterium]|jgi:hypothetical protein
MTTLEPTIQQQILFLRGKQVLIDRDLAKLYGVETKVLNQAVKRNSARFPEEFRFQLSREELEQLVTNCDRYKTLKHTSYFPYAFSEQGVAMLSAVLRSETAIHVSIQIMQAFVQMRHYIHQNKNLIFRMNSLEQKQQFTDARVNQLFEALEKQKLPPEKGIFFDGEIFDAYKFALDLIKSAKKSIVLIDNYIDENTLTLLANRAKEVKAQIYTPTISETLHLSLNKHFQQYPFIDVSVLKKSHDRFLIIDDSELYHIGASVKDLGKKWFGFSKLNEFLPTILEKLNEVD